MSGTDDKPDDSGFLSRWSRKKLDARAAPAPSPLAPDPDTQNKNPSTGAVIGPNRAQSASQSGTLVSANPGPQPPAPSPELPPIESLTPDADFTPFMAKGVESRTRNSALKTLFTDPHFNKMDGLDTYIDDYTGHTPIPMEMLRSLKQAQMLFADEKKEGEPDAPRQTPPEQGCDEVPCDQTALPLVVQDPEPSIAASSPAPVGTFPVQ